MGFNLYKKNRLISLLTELLELAQEMPYQKSCNDCKNLSSTDICLLAGVKPPPEVILVGCESHVNDPDAMPF